MIDNTLIYNENGNLIITLETIFLPWTLDMYTTFTSDTEEENILYSINQDREYESSKSVESEKLEPLDWNDIDFSFDSIAYGKALAVNLIDMLKESIIDNVIVGISSDLVVHSPKYYNYDTDKIFIDFEINKSELEKYIDKNRDAYNKEKKRDRDGFWWLGNEYDTMLQYYISIESEKLLSENEYLMNQFENVQIYDFLTYEIKKDIESEKKA